MCFTLEISKYGANTKPSQSSNPQTLLLQTKRQVGHVMLHPEVTEDFLERLRINA